MSYSYVKCVRCRGTYECFCEAEEDDCEVCYGTGTSGRASSGSHTYYHWCSICGGTGEYTPKRRGFLGRWAERVVGRYLEKEGLLEEEESE